jgi:adenosylmethionine-8-amino-7-oxononanoate aminotransferase
VLDKVQQLEGWLRSGLAPLEALSCVGQVRVIGGVGILELVSDKTTRAASGYLDSVGPRLAAAFLERGLLLRPLGNILYFMPPYIVTESETTWAIEQIREVLAAFPPQ